MHDQFNTQGGRYGFRVELKDGRTLTEIEGTWDDVPEDAQLKQISVYDFQEEKALVTLEGCERYFFSNEGQGLWDGRTALVSKIFGGVKEGEALVTRVILCDGPPRAEQAVLSADDLTFSDSAYRAG
jgi:hypothetical protein